jgi:DNA-binding response OmpR family regulator
MSKILIVEDEQNILMAMRLCLERAGHTVETAVTGTEALNLAFNQSLDLVLLDLRLPEMNGFLVLEALRENESTAKLPVIVCSARTQEADKRKVKGLGADGFLEKPFLPSQLLEKVKPYVN